jgi:hypothetical protein
MDHVETKKKREKKRKDKNLLSLVLIYTNMPDIQFHVASRVASGTVADQVRSRIGQASSAPGWLKGRYFLSKGLPLLQK